MLALLTPDFEMDGFLSCVLSSAAGLDSMHVLTYLQSCQQTWGKVADCVEVLHFA